MLKAAQEAQKQKILAAFQAAKAAGEAANEGEDGGTCNFDHAVLVPEKGTKRTIIEAAAEEAGVRVSAFGRSGLWAGCWSVYLDADTGQGNKSTRVAKAMEKAMAATGVQTRVYEQMD